MDAKLAQFDDLFVGDPVTIEKNLADLLGEAKALEDKSIFCQILSQIALAQAMQQRFDAAHRTLDQAEACLGVGDHLARARVLLERGRVFHQAGKLDEALPFMEQSFTLSARHGLDFHTINAAHMIAIVVASVEEKIRWNKRAITLAESTSDQRACAWLGALHNNLAQNHVQAGQYQEALHAFQKCQAYGEQRGDAIVVRGAKWGVGRALRSLGDLDEALRIQIALLADHVEIARKGELPQELLKVSRGMVHEELVEIHLAKAKEFATLAWQDLAQNPWFVKLEPRRLEKLKRLQE